MSNKIGVSVTVNKDTVKQIKELATKEKRSLSQMIDILLEYSLITYKNK